MKNVFLFTAVIIGFTTCRHSEKNEEQDTCTLQKIDMADYNGYGHNIFEYTANKAGFITHFDITDSKNNKKLAASTLTYNDEGLLVRVQSDQTPNEFEIFTYTNGALSKIDARYSADTVHFTVKTDAQKRIIEMTGPSYYETKGDFTGKYGYNPDGLPTTFEVYDNQNKLVFQTEYASPVKGGGELDSKKGWPVNVSGSYLQYIEQGPMGIYQQGYVFNKIKGTGFYDTNGKLLPKFSPIYEINNKHTFNNKGYVQAVDWTDTVLKISGTDHFSYSDCK